jgi:signal peptidase I
MSLWSKVLLGLAAIPALLVAALFVLRVCGLVRPFSVPTGGMTPAISPGDHIMMEGISYLTRRPRRGDIVVFKTDGIASLPSATIYVKRVAGEPGDHVRISGGKLVVNGKQVSLRNAAGEINYNLPPSATQSTPQTDVNVPSGCYFVLGDNSKKSFDSRFWGSVPRGNIIGRLALCYWPPQRAGGVQ